MIDYNLHTHTKRCGHALGEDEEYVLRAIEAGIKVLGFSDHAPVKFSDGREQSHSVKTYEAKGYVESILSLGEKYSDKIKLHSGFEMEYYPTYFKEMLDLARRSGAEYLILGQHAIYDGEVFTHRTTESEELFTEMVRCILEAMQSGVFSYVCHPDLMNFRGDQRVYENEMKKIAKTSRELDIPLEINLLGIREGRVYPTERFFEIAGAEGAPITIGIDAHSPSALLDTDAYCVADWLIRKHHLNYVGMPKIRRL